jgi:hypothetical protein
VRVVQAGENLRHALETRQPLPVFGKSFRQDFDGDVAPETRVMRSVDLAHTPRTEFLENSVMGNRRAKH